VSSLEPSCPSLRSVFKQVETTPQKLVHRFNGLERNLTLV
jgi:hypothetical protein